MGSIIVTLALGFLLALAFRMALPYEKPMGGQHQLSLFGLGIAVALFVNYSYGNAITIVAAGIGLLTGLTVSLKKVKNGRQGLRSIFAGTMLVVDPLLGIAITCLFLFRQSLGKWYLKVWTFVAMAGVLTIYYLGQADIVGLYLLLFFVAELSNRKLWAKALWKRWKLIVFGVLPIVLFGLLFLNRYVYHGFGMQRDLFREGPQVFPVVALTFDDGPHPQYTNQILDILKEKNVKATFFLVGTHARDYPEVTKRISVEGHVIGNHTRSHANLLGGNSLKVEREILEGQRIIEEVTGERPRYFRPPRGLYNQAVLDLVNEEKLTLVLWSISSQDWAGVSWHAIVKNIMHQIRPGAVLLFHDSGDLITAQGGNRKNTVKALPAIIDQLQEQGYQFVTITDMLILSGLAGELTEIPEFPEDYLYE